LLSPPRPPELLDHELHAVPLLVLVVAVTMEHTKNGFGHTENLGGWQEGVDHGGIGDQNRGPAASSHPKAAHATGSEDRTESEIVDTDVDVIGRASLEGDLEFPGEHG